MKSEEEKKTRHVRTRMTQNQYKQVKEKADQRNQTVSAYVVEAAVHGDNHITPPMIMQLQNDFNEAADLAAITYGDRPSFSPLIGISFSIT